MYSTNFTGSSFFPSTAIGIPLLNLIFRYAGLSGRFFVLIQINALGGGSVSGFSNTPPSIALPHKF